MMLKTGGEIATATDYFDGHKFKLFSEGKQLKMAAEGYQNKDTILDVSWLPNCASKYRISPRIADYALTEIPIITVDVPNRNMDCFPMEAMMEWNDEVGRVAYATFIGKPAHKDHDNQVPERAKGVIFDARLVTSAVTNRSKLHILVGWDRTKDRTLVEAIVSGKRPGHSMGAMVGYTQCNHPGCGASDPMGKIRCAHLREGMGKGQIINGILTFEKLYRINGAESSSVPDPADHTANQLWVK